jgi:hypothetical protein
MRVMRANLDGSLIETLVETGRGAEQRDPTRSTWSKPGAGNATTRFYSKPCRFPPAPAPLRRRKIIQS